MPIKLNTASGGGVILQGANTASDKTITIPADDGTMIYANSSGNVGIGTSSPTDNLDVVGTETASNVAVLARNLSTSTNSNAMFALRGNNNSVRASWLLDGLGTVYGAGSIVYTETAHPLMFGTNGSERMRIDTSGNVGIGTSSPSTRLEVSSSGIPALINSSNNQYVLQLSYLSNTSKAYLGTFNNALIFAPSSATEAARIDSGGNLLVGTTDASASSGAGTKITMAGTNGIVSCVGTASTGAANTFNLYSTGAGAYRFYVTFGGQIAATSTSIVAISDVSLKENVRDLDTGLTQVMALRPRRFDWKEETQLGEKNVAGFIAQEVEQVLPELVYDYKYNEGENKKAVKMGDILPTLVKAIQEQQAMIEELKAKVAALEAK